MEEFKEKYNVNYSCGCMHELGISVNGFHKPTGNNQDCLQHKS